ncbi:hypothetical protein LR48_Vigan07g163200 [Vigna angularis]|uniref:Uncharacterized protein n=1 Tax=Phaseolus angularis TaxID=3914 RepID=A0A0L9UYS0_PHAAN|nr:hypothetical protein LR48_Vigan07g163200 [Vigna angularis]
MASSSSSKRNKSVARTKRNTSPTRWISDDAARNSGEGFLFANWLTHQGLAEFVQIKGNCYPELVEVFYNNLRLVNGDIHSQVKGVNIIINNDVWLLVARLKAEGCMSHIKDSLHNKRTTKKHIYRDCLRYHGRYKGGKMYLHKGLNKAEKMCAYILAWLLLLGRYLRDRLIEEDLYLLNVVKSRIPTNLVSVFKEHMIDTGINDEHNLPYGVFISKILKLYQVVLSWETKIICNRTKEIGKAILTCIGMKNTTNGWVFSDVQNQYGNTEELSEFDDDSISFSPKSKFERFVMNKFKKVSERTGKMRNSLFIMEKKLELIKNCVYSSSSTEESSEDDESSEENSMEKSKLE